MRVRELTSKRAMVAVAALGALVLAGCGVKAEVADTFAAMQPACIAVLPVQNETVDMDGPGVFRAFLEQKIAAKGYSVLSREQVDQVLLDKFDVDPEEGGQVMSAEPTELSKELGCDGLFYATVTEWDKKTLWTYNSINVFGRFELLSGQDGARLFYVENHGVSKKKVTDPTNVQASLEATAMNLLESYDPLAEQTIDQVLAQLPNR